MKIKNLPTLAICLSLCVLNAHASGWSLRERGYIRKIPGDYAGHKSGIVSAPNDEDVKRALEFGAASKEKSEPLEYAYLFKSQESVLNNDSIYVTITTPLALIAYHARDKAKEYRATDQEFINYVRSIGAAAISVNQQFITAQFRAVAFKWEIILLRDGVRVEPLTSILSWKGSNPFKLNDSLISQNNLALAAVQEAAMQQLRATAAGMDDYGKGAMVRQFAATGWSDARICNALGITPTDLARLRGDTKSDSKSATSVTLTERDAVYSIEDLRKQGRYEIVFRRPEIAFLGGMKDKEIRFPITLANFK